MLRNSFHKYRILKLQSKLTWNINRINHQSFQSNRCNDRLMRIVSNSVLDHLELVPNLCVIRPFLIGTQIQTHWNFLCICVRKSLFLHSLSETNTQILEKSSVTTHSNGVPIHSNCQNRNSRVLKAPMSVSTLVELAVWIIFEQIQESTTNPN